MAKREYTEGTWTLDAIAWAVKNNLEAGLKGNMNYSFSIEQLKAEVIAERNAIVKQLKQSGLAEAESLYQEINCIELDCKDFGLCCEIDTRQPTFHFVVPYFNAHNYTGLATQHKPFNIYSPGNNTFIYNKYRSSFTNNKPFVVYRNHEGQMHGFIFNPPTYNLKYISVRAVFENPLEVNNYSCCVYNPETDRFPAPDFIINQIITQMVGRWSSWYYRFQGQRPSQQTPNL